MEQIIFKSWGRNENGEEAFNKKILMWLMNSFKNAQYTF